MFQFHHVALSVKDIDESMFFYSCFGFVKKMHWLSKDLKHQVMHMKLGDFILELFYFSDHQNAPQTTHDLDSDLKVIGIKHFCLNVESIEKVRDEIIQKGFPKEISIKKGKTGFDYFFIKDPSGILLEVVQDNRDLSEMCIIHEKETQQN